MVRQAEEFKADDAKRREAVDLKNEVYNTHETITRQLNEFRSQLPQEEVEAIEKTLQDLATFKDKDISPG